MDFLIKGVTWHDLKTSCTLPRRIDLLKIFARIAAMKEDIFWGATLA